MPKATRTPKHSNARPDSPRRANHPTRAAFSAPPPNCPGFNPQKVQQPEADCFNRREPGKRSARQ